jgi:ketosteroid isomerase-like protein
VSQENLEVVQAIYRSLNEGDWDGVFRFVDPEFEATFQRGLIAGTHTGRDAVRAIVDDQRAAFDGWITEVERLVESGDRVVAVTRTRWRPKGTDAEIENRNGWIWTIRDGRAVSMCGFPNPNDALEAVGHSEQKAE